jgi:hypothetical protein
VDDDDDVLLDTRKPRMSAIMLAKATEKISFSPLEEVDFFRYYEVMSDLVVVE